MPSLDLLRRNLLATAAVFGFLLGGIIGLFLPIRPAAAPKSLSEGWSLPAISDTKRFREDSYAALRSARFWKTVPGPGQQGALKVEWTLAGIITNPRPMAVISRPGGAVPDSSASNVIAMGGQLPDGSTLVRMTRDAVWFEKDGCVRERRLYRPVTAENNACFGEKVPSTANSRMPIQPSAPGMRTPANSGIAGPDTAPAAARSVPSQPPGSDPARSAPSAPTVPSSAPTPAPATTPVPQPVDSATP